MAYTESFGNRISLPACIMSGAYYVTALAPIGTFALSSTDKIKTLIGPNKDTNHAFAL